MPYTNKVYSWLWLFQATTCFLFILSCCILFKDHEIWYILNYFPFTCEQQINWTLNFVNCNLNGKGVIIVLYFIMQYNTTCDRKLPCIYEGKSELLRKIKCSRYLWNRSYVCPPASEEAYLPLQFECRSWIHLSSVHRQHRD